MSSGDSKKLYRSENVDDAFTITFGDQVENGIAMQQIGKIRDEGFTTEDLREAKLQFEEAGATCELYNLNLLLPKDVRNTVEKASVLIIRDGARLFADPDKLYKEQKKLVWDAKKKDGRRKIVVNSIARWNLCYSDFTQEPDYEDGKGRVYDFKDLRYLSEVRKYLPSYLNAEKSYNLPAEGNYYYEVNIKKKGEWKEGKCGIGFHGDSERSLVIGLRLGASFPLVYRWFHESEPASDPFRIDLHHGDMYVMSDKTTGRDWKKQKIYTLRHAAGASKYTNYKKQKKSE